MLRVILGIIGLILSFLIFYSKERNKKLICFIGKDCNKVIHSKYARTFGLRNEIIGMIFYLLVIINVPYLWVISLVALVSSIYLFIIQVFKLKEYCDYCILTGIINLGIFLLV
jgi:uncharacterized membrane protein